MMDQYANAQWASAGEQAGYAMARFQDAASAIDRAAIAFSDPHVRMRPRLSIDGNKWCALYGENLQDGVAGFGDTPAEACQNFDLAWLNQKATYPQTPSPPDVRVFLRSVVDREPHYESEEAAAFLSVKAEAAELLKALA